MASNPEDFYECVASCKIGGVPVLKYVSKRTKMIISIAQVEGPLVNGYFCLATEAHDHDGLPHTLEHLVFMGSEKYPYKGVLDLLANRCLAQGTNAWTDVDHTCYTITTAGTEGFLNLLPIYLDHILYPTLTDPAYTTEVHHINGEGENAGVVYCEMQARENTSEDRTHFEMLQLMYSEGCGYRSETGGRMSNLRDSTSNEKVTSYHSSYYRPDNLNLIITGQIEPRQIFKSLSEFEEKILSKGELPQFTRPWQSPVAPLNGSHSKVVQFPTSEEDDGLVRICWRGPKASQRYLMTAMEVIMEYLTDTPVAPLQRELVEIEDPYCSDVDCMELENSVSVFGIAMEGVPYDKLNTVEEKVVSVLQSLSDGSESVDMSRMASILKQRILKILNQVEECPHYFFAFSLIGDFLFRPDDFGDYLDQVPRYEKLLNETESFWVELITEYFVTPHRITILGTPSAELSEKMETEEKERIQKQREELKEEGLKEKKEILEDSIKQNEAPPPDDVVSSLPVPSTDSISFHPINVLANHNVGGASETPEGGVSEMLNRFPVGKLPFFLQVNHIKTKFVEFSAVLDTSGLPKRLRFYLSLYSELLFESPVLRNGELIPYETVVKELQANTISHSSSLGIRGGGRFMPGQYPDALLISIKVEHTLYM
ncbi:PREDICTED: uncharacterized protein C05D11.1-like [Amphimedon queenslandica]|uniref:Presequence protease, mitochondrial n=2 Tax=Amphimedon queenslandica TaxID=400682 RepID=A0AAN0IQ13_AMPQE|nr:PREDICTED: uncharacterized protein C05D11.1-like [Amphimedon queenslandica]|eukprot:XP_011407072.2 PREDICTED: uncharacterized protein C05D11.1-like [Amphimedon queenslandica]